MPLFDGTTLKSGVQWQRPGGGSTTRLMDRTREPRRSGSPLQLVALGVSKCCTGQAVSLNQHGSAVGAFRDIELRDGSVVTTVATA